MDEDATPPHRKYRERRIFKDPGAKNAMTLGRIRRWTFREHVETLLKMLIQEEKNKK